MEIQDFSHGFDTLLNSYATTAAQGSTDNPATIELDEYEKSVFLTKAQKDLALDLYSGRNPIGASFEETEELRRYLSPLVKEITLNPIPTTNGKPLGVDSKSKFFTLPEDLWFITYESVVLSDGKCEDNIQMVFIDTSKNCERSFRVSVLGTVSPVSQRDTAWRVTNTFSASCS